MAWLTGYGYRKDVNITAGSVGSGTDYQVFLKIGETSGATGEDFDVEGHCQDFPYDITFTDNDEQTELKPTLIAISGSSPNRLALFRVKVADDLDSNQSICCYYSKSNATPVFDPTNTFALYGKLGAQNYEWCADTGEELTEHSVIYKGNLFVPACDYTNKNGGVKKYSPDGELLATYAATTYTQAAPILFESDGIDYMILYDLLNYKLNRVKLSDNSITHNVTVGSLGYIYDFESMGWDVTNNRVIIPMYNTGDSKYYLRAYNMADLSVAWSYQLTTALVSGTAAAPIVVDSYVYWKHNNSGVLFQLNLSDGTLNNSIDLTGYSAASYASPIYDPDNSYIYTISSHNKIHAINPSGMSELWNHTFAAGSGSDTNYVTYTGMTTPIINNVLAYHNGKVIFDVRENAAGANQYHSKVYAITSTTGYKAWIYTGTWDDGQDPTTLLLTDDHVVLSTLDYDYSSTNYHVGYFYVLNQSDGTLVVKGALPWDSMCGGATQAYAGRVFFNMGNGLVCAIKVGWGVAQDSIHWMKNSYHNGYCGTSLTIDTSLTFSVRSATITNWTENGGTSIDAEGFGMRLTEHENHFGHVEKAASALTNFCLEGRIYFSGTVGDLAYTWAPKICAYWDVNDWIGIGLAEDAAGTALVHYYHNLKNGTLDHGRSDTISQKTWYWYRIRVDASNIYEDYSTDYINWTTLRTQAREATWGGAASLIIVGKGYSDGATYPNADLDNNWITAGNEATMHFLDVWQRKYAVTEPAFASAGSEETQVTFQPWAILL